MAPGRGRAVRVDPMKPMLKGPGAERLKVKCDKLLSTSAFEFNLRRFNVAHEISPDFWREFRTVCVEANPAGGKMRTSTRPTLNRRRRCESEVCMSTRPKGKSCSNIWVYCLVCGLVTSSKLEFGALAESQMHQTPKRVAS